MQNKAAFIGSNEVWTLPTNQEVAGDIMHYISLPIVEIPSNCDYPTFEAILADQCILVSGWLQSQPLFHNLRQFWSKKRRVHDFLYFFFIWQCFHRSWLSYATCLPPAIWRSIPQPQIFGAVSRIVHKSIRNPAWLWHTSGNISKARRWRLCNEWPSGVGLLILYTFRASMFNKRY